MCITIKRGQRQANLSFGKFRLAERNYDRRGDKVLDYDRTKKIHMYIVPIIYIYTSLGMYRSAIPHNYAIGPRRKLEMMGKQSVIRFSWFSEE